MSEEDWTFLNLALEQAQKSLSEGGIPIGAVLVQNGKVLGQGHNQRVQQGNPILHGEMDCLQNAGRQRSYSNTTLYTTLSPCFMCTGTILQFGIPRVVIGEDTTFGGFREELTQRGVTVILANSTHCKTMMTQFIAQHPDLWKEDISED